ncbi:MAG: hypothetical protein H5U28_10110 [Burkholderiaceae bacterium]|nr:hypothetical protein [Burkholderiaceae bacterium]
MELPENPKPRIMPFFACVSCAKKKQSAVPPGKSRACRGHTAQAKTYPHVCPAARGISGHPPAEKFGNASFVPKNQWIANAVQGFFGLFHRVVQPVRGQVCAFLLPAQRG